MYLAEVAISQSLESPFESSLLHDHGTRRCWGRGSRRWQEMTPSCRAAPLPQFRVHLRSDLTVEEGP